MSQTPTIIFGQGINLLSRKFEEMLSLKLERNQTNDLFMKLINDEDLFIEFIADDPLNLFENNQNMQNDLLRNYPYLNLTYIPGEESLYLYFDVNQSVGLEPAIKIDYETAYDALNKIINLMIQKALPNQETIDLKDIIDANFESLAEVYY